MFTKFLWHYQKINARLGIIAKLSLYFFKFISDSLGRNNNLEVNRFIEANNISSQSHERKSSGSKSIGLVVVASGKDFELLNWTIPSAIDALGETFNQVVKIVVPGKEISSCLKLVCKLEMANILVLPEEDFIDSRNRDLIRLTFQNRYGWALQQFLKVSQVIGEKNKTNLVLDADTILLRTRKWFDDEGRQCLFPSWEFNPPYYSLLSNLGIGQDKPKFTFVTHHMIMQESLMREAMMKIGAFSINDLIQIVVENVSAGESSFCIEYELYAQFLISHRSDRIFFDKWSNIGVPRSRILGLHLEEIKKLYPDYFSLSAHDYISQSSKAF